MTNRASVVLPLFERKPRRRTPRDIERFRPTPLDPEGSSRPIQIDAAIAPIQRRSFWTAGRLLRFLLDRIRLRLAGKLTDQAGAVLARELFEELGGMWIKVGQLMSLRTDLMSEAMCRELASLQYAMRGFPLDVARGVVESELGRPIQRVFSHFEAAPVAAASIAQVHRATLLHDNRAVMVKIMRPDVADRFNRDLRLLENLVRVLSWLGLFRRFNLKDGLAEMRAVLTEETHYRYEALNLRRMRKSLADHGVHVPRVIRGLSRQRVLVMEEVPGVLLSHYIRVRRDNPDRAHGWASRNGIEMTRVARKLTISVLRQLLEENEFHGDLHPGNVMLLSDNEIALIDFGSVGRLDQRTWRLYQLSLGALADNDFARAGDLMLMMSPSVALSNTTRLRHDMATALRHWQLVSQFDSARYVERSIAAMSNAVSAVMAKHNVPLGWTIMRVGRTLSTLDGSLQTLTPDADFMKMCRVYFRDRQRRMLTWRGRREVVRSVLREASTIIGDAGLLWGVDLREQGLRLSGVVDRVTQVRVIVLTMLHRGLRLATAFVVCALVLGALYDYNALPPKGRLTRIAIELNTSFPALHSLHWGGMLIFCVYLVRLTRKLRSAIDRAS